MNRHEIQIVGDGGQGTILATVILAEAALMSGKHAAQSQSYGPEARGSSCKAETIISDVPIGFAKVQTPTCILAMCQKALDQYTKTIGDDCLLIIDASLTAPAHIKTPQVVALPFIETAQQVVGKTLVANVIAIGALNEFLGIADKKTLQAAMLARVPKQTEKLNTLALSEGIKLAANWKKEHSK